jgi:mono/diheme cytochrome c family protein
MFYRLPWLCLTLGILLAVPGLAQDDNHPAEEIAFFERKVRPLLSQHCYSCHSKDAKVVHGELHLDSVAGIIQGGESGAVVVAGKPDESLLIHAVQYQDGLEMPPKGQLSADEIAPLVSWINRGAVMPPIGEVVEKRPRGIDFNAGRQFWSFQPAIQQPLPATRQSTWPLQRLDHFILAKMEKSGLKPSARADRATLIRRLSFDLVGLPPTPEEVEHFVNDDSPEAYRELVERLLASPHYGEKWGRMWLDLARYTDFTASWLEQPGEAYFYRDWVVQAFNDDMPYDDFIHRQLATDLMPETGPEDLAALGMISLSPTYWKELKLPSEIIKVIVADEWEERIAAVCGTFLGLTVACARCHDHKFDPISSEDYYALAGVFASTRSVGRPMVTEEEYAPARQAMAEVEKLEAEVKKLNEEIAQLEKKLNEAAVDPPVNNEPQESESEQVDSSDEQSPTERLAALKSRYAESMRRIETLKMTPHFGAPLASGLTEESVSIVRAGEKPQDGTRIDYRKGPQDLPLFVRGDPNRPGEVVPRRFLTVLTQESKPFQQGSGRLEFARAMTQDAASLTARVMVNRIWLAHFGRGLVNTPSDLGAQGDRPTHPELLDDLAKRFMDNGWSIKWLHREILHSATWQQVSQTDSVAEQKDPANLYLSHMNRRRLDFEPWRDAMLSASGVLDLTMGGKSISLDQEGNSRRTLYGTVHRRDMSNTLLMHDFPDPTQHSPKRSQTTTALQGLFLLNGPLLAEQAGHLAHRLERERPAQTREQVARAYALLFSRPPTVEEAELASQFLGVELSQRQERLKQYAQVLFSTNEFLYVD